MIGDEIWLDPTDEESKISSGTLILSGMPALEKITSVWQSGSMTPAEAMKVRSLYHITASCTYTSQCMDACQERYTEIHAAIVEALQNTSNT